MPTVLLHNTTIDADTLGRLIAAARRTGRTTRVQAEEEAAKDMESFRSGPPRQTRVDVTLEALVQIAEAARTAAEAAQDTEPGWSARVRGDLRAAEVACEGAVAAGARHGVS